MSRGMGIANPMWFVGVVENNDDPTKQGRVQVREQVRTTRNQISIT
jgi:hypothetical protein